VVATHFEQASAIESLRSITKGAVMATFEHLLVPTDFSDASKGAIRAAAGIAGQFGARVSLLHVYDPKPPGLVRAAQDTWTNKAYDPKEAEAASAELAQIRSAELDNLRDVALEVRASPSASAGICEVAGNIGADLVVLGTHGRTSLARLFIGSVAERVVRHAPCSVMTVTPSAAARAMFGNGILVATDLSEAAEGAVAVGVELAREFGAPLELVSAVDPTSPMVTAEGSMMTKQEIVELTRLGLQQRLQQVAGVEQKRAEVLVDYPVAEVVCDYAGQREPELLVVATHGRRGVKRVLLGSVAERIVRHAPCPVLTVRAN
jgi:nucleotide-binding universal stress UspA family protein